ncbi:MAG: porin [Gammaproteobacteria bacterium]|nr:porin [Gammaproteobacteria bacterium]
MWKSRFAVPAALTLAMALPAFALASGEEINHLKRENAEMKQMLMQMQEQLQEVMMKTNAMQQQAKKAAKEGDKKGGRVKSKKEDITISTTGGGIKVKSSKGNEFKIGGRLMYDYDSYDDFWASDDADDAEIRRSRITLSGKSGKNWSYKFTTNIDHEDNEANVDTGYLKYSSKPMYAMLGKYKRPGMLEERTSSKWISTIERSIINELSGAVIGKPDFGGISVGFATKGDMPMSGVVGVYDDQVDDPDDGGNIYGVGARFSIMPKLSGDSFIHAGASFYTVDYKGNNHRMRTRMGVHTTGRPFETDNHETDDINQFGVELAYVNGPFSLQGEFMNVESDGTDNAACGAAGTYTPGAAAIPAMEETVYQMDEDGDPVLDDAGNKVAEMEKYLVMQVATGEPDDPSTADDPSTTDINENIDESVKEVEVDLGVSQEDLEGYEVGQSFGAVADADDDGTVDADTTVDSTAVGDFIVRERALTRMTEAKAKVDEIFSDAPAKTCDIEMDGFYLQAAYTLTGETRGYKGGSGAFAAIKPKNEGGAWEVVARYEDADIDIPGRSLSADLERMVLGVNWYVNKNVKFMLNYVDSEVDGCTETARTFTADDGVTVPTDHGHTYKIKKCNNDDGQAFSLRGQYVF